MLGVIYNQLLKEVKPIWYYYFQEQSVKNYFSDYDKMSEEERNIIPLSKEYNDERMKRLDASFIACGAFIGFEKRIALGSIFNFFKISNSTSEAISKLTPSFINTFRISSSGFAFTA